MKKYIIPNTEAIEAICGTALCHSNDGEGAQFNPNISSGSGSSNAAPGRASILYI